VERGLYIAASGMLAAEVRQDVIANNLANATNAGFKGDKLVQESFGDLLLQQATSGAKIGPLNTGTQVVQISPDLANQGFRWTQRSLDLAIGGDGWFTVQTPTGTAYTRDGAFTTNAQGQITTADGYAVLGVDGKPISVAGNGRIGVDAAGRVSVNGKAVGQLKVTDLQAASVKKLGGDLVSGAVDPAGKVGSVAQGALENSNVNSVLEMVNLIENMRLFESDQKVVQAIDSTLDKAVNQVGRV